MAHCLKYRLEHALTLALLTLASCTALSCAKPSVFKDGATLPISVNGHAFHAEIELTPESRIKGLGGRAVIADDFAMLFAWPMPRQLNFVMRDCHFPIAVLFLDDQGRVVATHKMPVEPAATAEDDLIRYPSGSSAQFALEIKAERLDALGVVIGETKIELPIEALTQAAQ